MYFIFASRPYFPFLYQFTRKARFLKCFWRYSCTALSIQLRYALKTREWICPLSENELSWNRFIQVISEECWRCAVSLVSLWLGCSTSQLYWFDSPTASCSFYRSPFRRLLPLPFTLSYTLGLLPPQVGYKTEHLHHTSHHTLSLYQVGEENCVPKISFCAFMKFKGRKHVYKRKQRVAFPLFDLRLGNLMWPLSILNAVINIFRECYVQLV